MTAGGLERSGVGFVRILRNHRAFSALALIGIVLRLFAVLGYRPALLYNDTFEYVDVALRLRPFPERPDGYSFFLRALEPAHSFVLVVVVQHLLGLGTSVLIYALARRRFGLPAWAGCLAAAPVLLDAYWIELEHVLLSDTLFTALLVSAVGWVVRRRRLSAAECAGVGLLLAAATVTRPASLPAVVGIGVFLLIRRVGRRPFAAFAIALALPLVGYASWYSADQGRFALDDSTGIQFYGRVAGFADCSRMNVASHSELAPLCPEQPGNGLPAPAWLWYRESPLRQMGGPVFTPSKDRLAMTFAERAVLHQPGDYLAAVGKDLWHAVGWTRGPYPNAFSSTGWSFPVRASDAWPLPKGGFEERAMTRYEHGSAATTVHGPFASVLHGYQEVVAVRGPMLALLAVLAFAGLAGRRRQRGLDDRLAPALVAFVGLGLALVPIFTVQLDYRYLMPSYPFLGLAAVVGGCRLAAVRRRGDQIAPPQALPVDGPEASHPPKARPSDGHVVAPTRGGLWRARRARRRPTRSPAGGS